MDYDGRFIIQKAVDWSLLNDGMTIPVSCLSSRIVKVIKLKSFEHLNEIKIDNGEFR